MGKRVFTCACIFPTFTLLYILSCWTSALREKEKVKVLGWAHQWNWKERNKLSDEWILMTVDTANCSHIYTAHASRHKTWGRYGQTMKRKGIHIARHKRDWSVASFPTCEVWLAFYYLFIFHTAFSASNFVVPKILWHYCILSSMHIKFKCSHTW